MVPFWVRLHKNWVFVLVSSNFIASIKNVEGKNIWNFRAFGPDFQISNTIFEMCAKICQAATKREKITTIENV